MCTQTELFLFLTKQTGASWWGDKMRLRRESPKTDKDVKILTMIKRHRGEGGNKKLLNLWIPALIRRGRPNSPLESVLFWIEFQICSFACHQFIPSLIISGLNYPNPKWYCPATLKRITKMMCIVWCWWRSWWWQGGGSDKRELDIGCVLVCTCVLWALVYTVYLCALSTCAHCVLVCTEHLCALCTGHALHNSVPRLSYFDRAVVQIRCFCLTCAKAFIVCQGYLKYSKYIEDIQNI